MALNLHSWYSGLERLLEAIAIEFDGGLPEGDAWHAELLRQMSLDLSPSRPPVLTTAAVAQLDEYRKFRHLIRNIYATNLSAKRMEGLVLGLPDVWGSVQDQLTAFGAFVDDLELPEAR